MKNAMLWKRILFEGVDCEDIASPSVLAKYKTSAKGLGEQNQNAIMGAPIIVDNRIGALTATAPDWLKLRLAMPFNKFWIEGPVEDEPPEFVAWRWGGLVDYRPDRTPANLQISIFSSWPGGQPSLIGNVTVRILEDGRLAHVPPVAFADEEGPIEVEMFDMEIGIAQEAVRKGIVSEEQARCNVIAGAYMAMDAISLMSCTNVGVSPRDPDPKLARIATKRHGKRGHGYRYHVLVVRPAGYRGPKVSPEGEEIGAVPRHVCRGHFQHYGAAADHGHPDGKDRGRLFGHLSGRFYIPPHMKGKKENGEVAKDYALTAHQESPHV